MFGNISMSSKKSYIRKNLLTVLPTILTILIVNFLNIPNPAIICLIAVAFSAFIGGLYYGGISGFITILYCGYFFSIPGKIFCYTSLDLYKMIVIFIAVLSMIFMVGTLKRQVDGRTKDLEAANEQLHLISTRDGLTGILNRRYFEELLDKEWQRSLRDRRPLSLALLDVDFFKKYNDTYGHQAGDECLRQVTKTIINRIHRPGDFTARYGGEEFVVLMSNTTAGGAVKVGEDIRQLIENLRIPHEASDINQYVTISMGVASMIPSAVNNSDELVKKADIALYYVKRSGRNRVLSYHDDMEKEMQHGILRCFL